RVDRFGRIAVKLRRVDAAADRHAHGDRAREGAPSARSHARGLRAELVVRGAEEAFELDLRDRPHAGHRQADRRADDAAFGQWLVNAAVLAELFLQSFSNSEDAAVFAHVLPEHDDARVLLHLLMERQVDRFDEIQLGHLLIPYHGFSTRAARNTGWKPVIR